MIDRRQFISLSALGLSPLTGLGQTYLAWQASTPLPIKIQELYPAVHQQQLFVAGGIAAKLGVPYFTNRCFSFDPIQNAWQEQAELPQDMHHAAMVSTGDDLYQIGGFNGAYTHIWKMQKNAYHLTKDGWRPTVNLPKPQAEGVLSTAPDGAIHLVTGQSPKGQANKARSDHTEVHDHWRWDTSTTQWEQAAPIPTARNSATGGWVGDQLIVTGGRTSRGNLSVTEIYDSKEDQWRTAAPLPLPQAGTASVVDGERLIVMGGEIFVPEADVFGNVWQYKLSTDNWEPLPNLKTPRHGLGAGLIDGKIYAIGGATEPSGRGTSDANEVLMLRLA